MRFGTLAVTVAALAVAPAVAAVEPTDRKHLARYCSASGDICLGIVRDKRGVVFQLTTMARYFPQYTLCVRAPRGSMSCRTVSVVRQGRVWGSQKRWPRQFGESGPGVYRVTWTQNGVPLGPTLRFRHR